MMLIPAYICIALLAFCFTDEVDCATKDSAVYALVYNNIDASSYDKCVRVMNGTKQIGCQSELQGNVGVLLLINKTSDIDKVNSGSHHPYIPLIHADIFSGDTVKKLQESKKVNGIIVFANDGYTGRSNGWSPEPKCPRYVYGLYNDTYGPHFSKCTNQWNIVGDGLSSYDIEFPVFYMQNQTATNELLRCHDEHNVDGSYPFCAVQMEARMDGAVSTETCIRRNNAQYNLSPSVYCQPMGGQNIMSMLQSSSSINPDNRPIILIMAALDSRSFMLASRVPGVNTATGFIALLSVAQVLGNLTQAEKDSMTHRVMFELFDGEAFDNTGSTRMVYDMSGNAFPFSPNSKKLQPENIDLSKVEYVIEIGQLGYVRNQTWMHFNPISNQSVSIRKIMDTLHEKSEGYSAQFTASSTDTGLPPSSLQSLLKDRDVPGVLISDFNENYSNRHYFSAYDTPDKLGVEYNENMTESEAVTILRPLAQKIGEISDVVSSTVYKLGSGNNLTSSNSDVSNIANTLYCYLFNGSCTFFWLHADSSVSRKKTINSVIQRYVSVYDASTYSQATYLARNLFIWYTGEVVSNITESKDCKAPDDDDRFTYVIFVRNASSICVRAPVYLTDGRSPSVLIPNYDYAGGDYPAWSESQWSRNPFRLTVFMVQDPTGQGMVLMCGLLFFFFSLIFVIFTKKKSDLLFNAGEVL